MTNWLPGFVQHSLRRAPVRQPSAESAVPSEAAAIESSQAGAATHLEFLGYGLRPLSDGWVLAHHSYRYNFCFRAFDGGIRLHCVITGVKVNGGGRRAWMEFLNQANDRSHVASFSLVESDSTEYEIRVHAVVTGAYERRAFARLMDMWHDDLASLRFKPPITQNAQEGSDRELAVVVH